MTQSHEKAPESPRPKPRMLLVDDDETLRRALTRLLSPHFEVTAAADAEAALAQLDGGFDVILTDYEMPHTNGVELLAQVKARDPGVYRALTSSGNVPDLRTGLDSGLVQRFLQKPVSREELQRLHAALSERAPR